MLYVSALIEHLLEVFRNLAEEMIARVASVNAVIAVCVCQLAEVFIRLNEGFRIFRCISEMHIVVCHTMNEEQFAAKHRGATDGTNVVT